jgi:hypothetical protein
MTPAPMSAACTGALDRGGHVIELPGFLREGPAGDQLVGWPAAMRVFARRERPNAAAQLTLFKAEDGWRYSLCVTNLPASTGGWRG